MPRVFLRGIKQTAKEFFVSPENRRKMLKGMTKTLPDPAARRLIKEEGSKILKATELKNPKGRPYLGKAHLGIPVRPKPAGAEISIIGKMARGTSVKDYDDFVQKTSNLFPPGDRINISVAMNEGDIKSLKGLGHTAKDILMDAHRKMKTGTINKKKYYRILSLTGFFTALQAMPQRDLDKQSSEFQQLTAAILPAPKTASAGPIFKAFKIAIKKMGGLEGMTLDDVATNLIWTVEDLGRTPRLTQKQAYIILKKIDPKEFGEEAKYYKGLLEAGEVKPGLIGKRGFETQEIMKGVEKWGKPLSKFEKLGLPTPKGRPSSESMQDILGYLKRNTFTDERDLNITDGGIINNLSKLVNEKGGKNVTLKNVLGTLELEFPGDALPAKKEEMAAIFKWFDSQNERWKVQLFGPALAKEIKEFTKKYLPQLAITTGGAALGSKTQTP